VELHSQTTITLRIVSYLILIPKRWDAMYLMTIAASLQTIVILLEKYIFDRADFLGAFLSIIFAMFLSGLLMLSIDSVRSTLIKDLPKLKSIAHILIAIELINWLALYTGQTAIKLGIPILVSAIEATIPAFAFCIALVLGILNRRVEVQTKLPFKLSAIGLMMLGVWLIGTSSEVQSL
jgi:hypothetical protein